MTEILAGLKVIELATVLAGPLVGSFLGEHGADVTKIEPPGGDVTRNWKYPNETVSSYFAACNWCKSSIELNLKDPANRPKLEELLRTADVVISNYLPRVEQSLKLTSSDIKQINAKIIHVKLLGYKSDPTKPAYDAVLQAETGWMAINGNSASGPMKLPVAVVDLFAAHHMKQALLLALVKRSQTGEGCVVSCDLESSALSNLANQAALSLAGIETQATGSLHPNIAPYGETLQFSNGEKVILAVGSNGQFEALCHILGAEALGDDERFKSNSSRVVNRSALIDKLQENVATRSAADFLKQCLESKVPVGKVNSVNQALGQERVNSLVIEDDWGRRITTSPFSIE